MRVSRADRIALVISLAAVLASWIVAERVFERMAHLEDEMAYVWQAQAASRGYLTLPSPEYPKSFLVPFIVDYQGLRFGKYPPGWPALLGIGVLLGVRSLVNPLLAGLGIWLTYILGKRVFSEIVGLIAAALTLSSPFFLMNSGSLLSHPMGLVLSTGFALAWLDAFCENVSSRPWLATLVAAGALGCLVLSRPMTALAVTFPFGLHAVYLFLRREPGKKFISWNQTRSQLVVFGGSVLLLTSLHFLWQYAVTGDPLMNPYILWWPYDRIGFGPGAGRNPDGHTLYQAYINTRASLDGGYYDLFGWGAYSWIFIPFGLIAQLLLRRRRMEAWLLTAVFPSLVLFYLAYWVGASLFGPRYYYEGLFSLTLLSAAGIAWLAGWTVQTAGAGPVEAHWRREAAGPAPNRLQRAFAGLEGRLRRLAAPIRARVHLSPRWISRLKRARPLAVTFIVLLMVSINVFLYLPIRLGGMTGLYGVARSHVQPFLTREAQELTPALVIVHWTEWIEYGTLLELETPFLDTPFIFVFSRGAETDRAVAAGFPGRRVYHYYADEPYKFYLSPRPLTAAPKPPQ